MADYTTIRISNDLKKKLDYMKGTKKLRYEEVIENAIEQSCGTFVDDITTINRETVAVTLTYMDDNILNKVDVTYHDLRIATIGTIFTPVPAVMDSDNYNYSTCELCFRKGDDVILLCKEYNREDDILVVNSTVSHVRLF